MPSVNWSKITLEKGVSKLDEVPKRPLPHIAIAGKSNVGKSSLINHVTARKHLAKISKTAGKTKRLDFYIIPDQFYLVDLPGYGFARVANSLKEKWSDLLEGYMQSKALSGVVFLIDARHDPSREDLQFWEWIRSKNLPVIVTLTKCDKVKKNEQKARFEKTAQLLGIPASELVAYTIESSNGRERLSFRIGELLWA